MPILHLQLNPQTTIDVIQESISQLENQLSDYRQLLLPEELEQSERFRFDKDKKRFILARGLLRDHLAKRTQQAPQEIIFSHGQHGKPYLKESTVQFNMSHSGDKIFIAFSKQAVGIDVEMLRQDLDYLALAQRFFTHEESLYLKALPLAQQQSCFFKFWVCKEAIIKALGTGLSHDLKSFIVDLSKPQPTATFKNQTTSIHLDFIQTETSYYAAYAILTQNI